MINFIIYEDDKNARNSYISLIVKMMGNRKEQYSIIELDRYNSDVSKVLTLVGRKIYILDVEVPGKSGMDLAREIREKGDWTSQIIVVTNHDNLQQSAFTSKLLMLNFISKFNNTIEELKKSLITSFMIVTQGESLKVQHNGEFCQIYYNDILFIKKESNDIDTTIVFSDGSCKNINIRMKEIEEKLKIDPRFFRTHRGCIVNMFKIRKVDFGLGIISFGRVKTNLLARDKKKEFRETLNNLSLTEFESNNIHA